MRVGSRTFSYALVSLRRRAPGEGRVADLVHRFRHRHDPYQCQGAVELVTEYLEGAMTAVELEQFEQHLSTCAECGRYVEQTRRTVDVLGRVHPPPPSRHICDALLRSFHDSHHN